MNRLPCRSRGVRYALATCLAGFVLLAGGCPLEKGEEPPSPPAAKLVSDAARTTFAARAIAARLEVRGRHSSYIANGLVAPADGRFRVEARRPGAPPRSDDLDKRVTVVGADGEGFESTFEETQGLFDLRVEQGKRCWFNPHSPVGFVSSPISVEESMRLSSAVLESLRKELSVASAAGEGRYLVELDRSASHPRNDFDTTKARVWGDRKLLDFVRDPIEVQLSEGRVTGLAMTLRDYRGERFFGRRTPTDVSIEVRYEGTNRKLLLDPPRCQALE